jgi:CBS domain-containing protein
VQRHSRRLAVAREVRDSLVSVAGLVGRPVLHHDGEPVGKVADVIAHWDTAEAHPPLAGVVARVGARRAFIPADAVATVGQRVITLTTARLDLRDFRTREGEAALVTEVLDHQLVDVDGARVIRAADLYLATVADTVRLVGVDVSFASLLRRLGPARWRTRPTLEAVLDWESVHSFGAGANADRGGAQLARHRGELNTMHPGELADLLEDLGRRERHQLLDLVEPATAADALEEMEPQQLHQLLAEADAGEAARYVARMEPDEAVEALRDLAHDERAEVLAAMAGPAADTLRPLLRFHPRSAGGEMTTLLVLASARETVADVRARLAEQAEHVVDLDAIIIVDDDGRLVDDISLGELFVAEPTTVLQSLVGPPWPVTVCPDADVREVAELLAESRRLSVVVLDEQGRPLGRILADDILDAVLAGRRRWQLPFIR